MLTISELKNIIKLQLLHNKNKSLFYGENNLTPCDEMINFIKLQKDDIAIFIENTKINQSYNRLLEEIVKITLNNFIKVNQFINFVQEDNLKLKQLYNRLFDKVINLSEQDFITTENILNLFHQHYEDIKTFLLNTNSKSLFKKYEDSPIILDIKCEEYSPRMQLDILDINMTDLIEPIIDIGCGEQAYLVHYLRDMGIEAYGLDRNIEENEYLVNVNWFEEKLKANTYGTVISHMAFSNHFLHHHVRIDGQYKKYIEKYMEILNSLKIGGMFIYAPNIPVIETLIMESTNLYDIHRSNYSTTITKLTI